MEIRKAQPKDAAGIRKVCAAGNRETYPGLLPHQEIERVIEKFYNEQRILHEIDNTSQDWNGWFVAVDEGGVVGAGGGGFTDETVAEVYVLYLDPERKYQGIGTKLLEAITEDQKARGAETQWVAVAKGNQMAIPFYEARGFAFQYEEPAYDMPEDSGNMSVRYMRKL
ncbi:GNAT family N-acetyltransferase [Planococcus maitriensis]|uniref:GNAT family N-acetyltransferase n=1 Tax=Planococcus maitriensis TaxID=221799 RepID=A0A365KA33_9BACL|nr:GNAT family N-acetyltransferase [Planococcus maitriensis]RAZ69615.1 GNAT family N-acetyltransferase [Planococcus maitriensis]